MRTPWPSRKARHALTGHLHKGVDIHLADIDALSHHLLHHHLHLLLLGGHGARWRAIVASWTRHGSTTHHLLELLQLRLTLLVGVGHGHLALAICFPGELVEAVVEVVGLVFARSSPNSLFLREIGVEVDLKDGFAQRRIDGVAVDVDSGRLLRRIRGTG